MLVANIFEYAWSRGQDLTLEDIILQVQKPPFDKLGVFPIDDYISERDRQKLALDLNNIIASPSFQSWLTGTPLDIQNLLYQPDGRPRVSIFYIAHLNESERQFIMTLILENMLGWMRTLSGTTSLRALLYIDEMFGYFPPYPRNPPTKEPMLRMLKQARAFGLGMILATQNPGDLDYKGLSNAGTWFIGRLQSQNDKDRVMSGLESMASVDDEMDIKEVEQMVVRRAAARLPDAQRPRSRRSGDGAYALGDELSTRSADAPAGANPDGGSAGAGGAADKCRCGAQTPQRPPSTPGGYAAQIAAAQVAQPQREQRSRRHRRRPVFRRRPPRCRSIRRSPIAPVGSTVVSQPVTSGGGLQVPSGFNRNQPPVPSTIAQYFLPCELSSQQAISAWEQKTNFTAAALGGAMLTYRPVLIAQASVRYQDRKTQVYAPRQYAYLVSSVERAGMIHWEDFETQPLDPRRVSGEPFADAFYGDPSPGMTDSKRMTALKREIADVIYTTKQLRVPYNPTLDLYGDPDGDFRRFRSQLQQTAREQRDAEMDALTAKYDKLLDRIDDQQQRKAAAAQNEKKELADLKREQLFTTGEAVLGLLKGRTAFTLSRMSRSAVYKQRSRGPAQHGGTRRAAA